MATTTTIHDMASTEEIIQSTVKIQDTIKVLELIVASTQTVRNLNNFLEMLLELNWNDFLHQPKSKKL